MCARVCAMNRQNRVRESLFGKELKLFHDIAFRGFSGE